MKSMSENNELETLRKENAELWRMVDAFSQQAADLKTESEKRQRKIADLESENAEWLKIYQGLQSEIAALKARRSPR